LRTSCNTSSRSSRNEPAVCIAGTAGITVGDAQQQAIDALFGGPAPRSQAETSMLDARPAANARNRHPPTVGPRYAVVDKGATRPDFGRPLT
jgi:hypothetical protein